MRIWYIHTLAPYAHERNRYRWKTIRDCYEADGHSFALFNLHSRSELRAFERSNLAADIAFVCDWETAEKLAKSRTDISKRAKFRAYITGGGWRRPEWVARGLKGISLIRPHAVFLSHRVLLDEYREAHKNVHYVGLGFDPNVFYPAEDKGEASGIVFCGNPAMGRLRRLKLMAEKFAPNRVEWRQGLSHAEYADFLRSGLIGWNQIASGPRFGQSCNLRVWEVLGSGILLLCSWSRHVADILMDGLHAVFWKNDDELVEKARYYMRYNAIREWIAKQGYELAIEKHTWRHRALEYQEIIEASL